MVCVESGGARHTRHDTRRLLEAGPVSRSPRGGLERDTHRLLEAAGPVARRPRGGLKRDTRRLRSGSTIHILIAFGGGSTHCSPGR